MNVSVQIVLGPDDTVPNLTPAEVLTAFGGDPDKDSASVTVAASHIPAPPPIQTDPAVTEPTPPVPSE